jgi:methyl-accepting chemotaxis protein
MAFFIFLALIVTAIGCCGIMSINRVSVKDHEELYNRASQEKQVLLMNEALQECRVHLYEAAMVRGDLNELKAYKAKFLAKRDLLNSVCDLFLMGTEKLENESPPKGSELESRVNGVKQALKEFELVADRFFTRKAELLQGLKIGRINRAALNASDSEQLNRLLRVDILYASGKVSAKLDELQATVGNQLTMAGQEVQAFEKSIKIAYTVLIIVVAMLLVIMGFLTKNHFSNWTIMFSDALKRVANGDLSAKIAVDSGNKLDGLGADFNIMMEKLGGMFRKICKTTEELDQISNNLSKTSREVINTAQLQAERMIDTSSAMSQINASVKGVAHGIDSLSLSAAESSSSIMEMAASIEEVALNVETLTQSVEEVSSSIAEMATSVKQIDTSVVSLTEAFTTTASSVMEMDGSIRQVEKNAMDTAAISEEVRKDAETGKESVVATITGIREIKRSSGITYEVINTLSDRANDIGAILSVIDEVAEQTNLLALNAAIIAAQAGERGKGFAVVADEIKELAERTSSSTREIAQVIKGVQDETRRAVEAINQAEKSIADGELLSQKSGEALNKIVNGVQMAAERVDEIARATVEQAKGSQMIRDAIERVLEMVGQIAMATREQGMGGELIMSAVEKMKELTAQVRVSTREQSKVGNFISRSTENITGMIQQIKRACDEQSRGSEQIVIAAEDIQHSTGFNLEATKVMNNTIMNLFRLIEIMQKEMDGFKI